MPSEAELLATPRGRSGTAAPSDVVTNLDFVDSFFNVTVVSLCFLILSHHCKTIKKKLLY